MNEVLVLGEIMEDESGDKALSPIVGELLAAAVNLGDTVSVVFLGTRLDVAVDAATLLGVDKVYVTEDPALDGPIADARVSAFTQIVQKITPKVVLIGRTPYGRDIGPRIAFRLGVGLAQDCVRVGLDTKTGRVVATRPVYGGNAMATVTFADVAPQIVMLRGGSSAPVEPDTSRVTKIIPLTVEIDPSVEKVSSIRLVAQESEGVRLEDAAIVVSGGRGLGGPEAFEVIQELADLLNGAMGASRAACDAGWIDHACQVGLTGRTVTSNLYLAVGISGASQHMAGCSGAKNIVAINRDAEANIFKEARYGVVGDWKGVLPSFVEAVRELVKS